MRIGCLAIVLLTLFTGILSDASTTCKDTDSYYTTICVNQQINILSDSGDHQPAPDGDHHCPVHCTHSVFLLRNPINLMETVTASQASHYQFSILEILGDLPFRPPLS